MEGNGHPVDGVLRWPGRVLAADDLRRSLNGHRELLLSPRAVITPLAADELRANGVAVRRSDDRAKLTAGPSWGYVQDRRHPMVDSAVESLRRDGVALQELCAAGDDPCRWARAVAECVARG